MKIFEGNGAECMVQFLKDGSKGTVSNGGVHISGDDESTSIDGRGATWEDAKYRDWTIDWLAKPCIYTLK